MGSLNITGRASLLQPFQGVEVAIVTQSIKSISGSFKFVMLLLHDKYNCTVVTPFIVDSRVSNTRLEIDDLRRIDHSVFTCNEYGLLAI